MSIMILDRKTARVRVIVKDSRTRKSRHLTLVGATHEEAFERIRQLFNIAPSPPPPVQNLNNAHGLRRTNADKRRAVATLLADSGRVAWSNNRVAKTCGVTQQFVRSVRARASAAAAIMAGSADRAP